MRDLLGESFPKLDARGAVGAFVDFAPWGFWTNGGGLARRHLDDRKALWITKLRVLEVFHTVIVPR